MSTRDKYLTEYLKETEIITDSYRYKIEMLPLLLQKERGRKYIKMQTPFEVTKTNLVQPGQVNIKPSSGFLSCLD